MPTDAESLSYQQYISPIIDGFSLNNNDLACANLRKIFSSLPPRWLADLSTLLRQTLPECPDPDRALNNLERFIAGEQGREAFPDPRRDAETVTTLLRLFSSSQFLSDLLIRHPEYVEVVRLPVRKNPDRQEMVTQLQQEVDAAFDETSILRSFCRFRQRQLLRIGCNDLIRGRSLEEITRDISLVADVAVEVALRTACRLVSQRFGEPMNMAGEPARCVVMAFGKLGGEELNYSSDIDLMFIYDEEGKTVGDRVQRIGNDEYFARVVTKVVRLLTTHTDLGQAYRVDLRLRPEGKRGPLARSLASTLAYYDRLGRTWERQALIKVRPIAGDLRLGEEFLQAISPFVYRKYLSLAEINEIKAMKRRMEANAHSRGRYETDVKTGFGGIRDIEFTIQFLQLLNGGDLPAVRTRNTLEAIHALATVGCLSDLEERIFDKNYRWLRQMEHHLQLMFDLQTHTIPEKEPDLLRLARILGYGRETTKSGQVRTPKQTIEAFRTDYRRRTDENRRILDHILHEAFADGDSGAEPETDLILDPDPSPEAIERVLGKYPFKDVHAAYRNLMQLATESVPFLSTRRCRHFLASIAPALLRAIAETPDPDLALVNLEKVSASLGAKGVLWELFSFSSAALRLYVDICAWSQFLVDILVNNPGMIDELLDSLVLNQPRTREELRQELSDLCRGAEDPDMILHSFRDKELLRIGVRDILGKDALKETTAALSDLAEVILAQITDLQRVSMLQRFGVPYLNDGARRGSPARFVILGLGKLGGREMSYHSDLDLILVYEGEGQTGPPPGAGRFDQVDSVTHYHYFTELAQRIIKAAGYMGPRGRLYHVDMRLRPTGKSGSLVISLSEFRRYYDSGHAQLWERQALTRARVVYGDEEFGSQVMQAVSKAAYELTWQPEWIDEIVAMRQRVQAAGSERDLKRGYGGIIDVEFLLQLFRLKYGRFHASLRNTNTWETLEACRDVGLLSDEEYQSLWSSYVFLRLVESRLRIVYNRSMDELPEDQEDLEKLARRLGFEADERMSAGERLQKELEQCLGQTRELFNRLVQRERMS